MRNKQRKNVFWTLLALALGGVLAFVLAACTTPAPSSDAQGASDAQGSTDAVQPKGTIRLATTTSTKDSGLLDVILPDFTAKTGYEVDVISVGSGDAMAMGENGEADVLLVHSPAAEKAFVEGGNADATGRLDVMYNDYVIIGPTSDPAGILAKDGNDAVAAFTDIADAQAPFISRGDNSGTNAKELAIWAQIGITPAGDWYVVAGDGMGAVITMADEKLAYTLSDRATWLSKASSTDLEIVCELDPSGILYNQYGVICVNPDKNSSINHDGAVAFQEWITSPETQALIGQYGLDTYGQALFVPNAA
ncbi:MAG: substrate-binding domain-containing protein [Eggerthellaceae bacterium]|nr:substrate-binding domain-containing protein [Eggerthellaceae bacterium]